jgi:hypothetical protein
VQSVKWLATGWVAEVQFVAGSRFFLFATTSRLALMPTQPPTVPGVKQPECEANSSPPSALWFKKTEDSC